MVCVLEKSPKANLCTSHPLGIRTSVSMEQPEKARCLIFNTDSGILMFLRFEHP